MHLKLIILAAAITAMPALAQAATITLGPGNASPSLHNGEAGLVVFQQNETSATPGTYIAGSFSATFMTVGSSGTAASFTPLVLGLIPGGFKVLAEGAALTVSAAAAYQSYTFGGSDTFTLTTTQALTIGFFMTTGGFGVEEIQPAGYGKAISNSFPSGVDVGQLIGYGYFANRGSTNALAVDLTVDTPEPASMALLGAGLLGLAAARRRRG